MQVQKTKPGYKFVKSLFGKYEEIPEEWEKKSIDDSCRILDSQRIPLNSEERKKIPGDIPYYGANGVQGNINKHLFDEDLILLAEDGGNFDEYQNRPIAYFISGKSWVNNHAHVLSAKSNNVLKWIFYSLVHKNILPWINGSTRTKLNQLDLKQIQILIPPISEQQKIASILTVVDNLIDSYDKTIETTKKLKKGLMKQLLTKGIGHKKFKKVKWLFGKEIEIPNNWISKKVEDVFKLKSGSTPSRTKSEFFEGDISWVTSTDLNRSKIISTIEKITKDAVKTANLTILPKGTFLIATYGLEAAGTRGKCGILEMDATCNQACMAFLPYSEMTSVFLFYFYLYFGEKIVFSIAQGTKQQNLYSDTVKKVTLLVPPLEEQEKIISILSEIDSKITDLESKKSRNESLKKGLMQKLLTGQIRV